MVSITTVVTGHRPTVVFAKAMTRCSKSAHTSAVSGVSSLLWTCVKAERQQQPTNYVHKTSLAHYSFPLTKCEEVTDSAYRVIRLL